MATSQKKSLNGYVVKEIVAHGSKSEHLAVCLRDKKGRLYRLRFPGGDPWFDPDLETWVGKNVLVDGEVLHGHTIIIESYKIKTS